MHQSQFFLILLYDHALIGLALLQPSFEILDDGRPLHCHFSLRFRASAFSDELVLQLPHPILLSLLVSDEFVLHHRLVQFVLFELLL